MNDVIPVYGLVPQSMAEAMKLADHMADAKLVPAALQKSASDCLMVIEQAIRWQMSPFAVAQECSVIQGKIMYSGKLVAAVVNSRGNLQNRLSYSYDGDGESRVVTFSGRLQGEIEPRTVSVILRNARTANKVWTTQPDQQLAYHGARVWARRHTPELMLGVYSPEEFEPEPLRANAKIPPRPAPNVLLQDGRPLHEGVDRNEPEPLRASAKHDPETGEIEDPSQDQRPSSPREGAPGSSDPADLPPGQSEPGVAFMLAARQAARMGETVFKEFYKNASPDEKTKLRDMKPELEALYPDVDEHRESRAAYDAGQNAKAAGTRRSAVPGEYRGGKLEACWQSGWDGDPFPMV